MPLSTDSGNGHGLGIVWAIVVGVDRSGFGLHGAYLRCDLEEAFGRRAVRNAVINVELRQLWRGVVVEAARFLDPWTRAAGVMLLAGPVCAISDGSAAALHGCTWIKAPSTHISLPPGRNVMRCVGVVVHNRTFYSRDVVVVDGVRMFALDRVVADVLCDGRPADALALTDEVLRMAGQTHGVVRKQIADAVQRRQDPRGRARAAALLSMATHRSASPPESWFRLTLLELGFPIPEVNWPLTDLGGRELYYLDLAWPDVRIVVEYDGYESHVDRKQEDAAREADLRRRGWIVIRAAKEDLGNPARVTRELLKAFADRGYRW